jgi:serine/threonine protein kinase/WD40 repeat protein
MPSHFCPHCQRPFTTSQDLPAEVACCPTCRRPAPPAPGPPTVSLTPQQAQGAAALGQGEEQTLPPASPQETQTLAPATPAAADGNGKPAIAGYQVERELGRGGMGVVYQALDLRLKRRVALKMVLVGSHAGEHELARFRTEAEAVARLQHPGIVQIHEVGVHGGLPFFSLEFCPGGSLDRKLDGTPLPAREAAALVQKLAQAMQAAHEKGVIHRDLKPANVLLAEDGTPKITDFGLARKLDEAGQTQTGSIMGTPSYMAPEQAGGHKDVGPSCDVYSLGAILYELLTGRPPFKAATPLDTVLQVLSDEPAPPRQLNGRVPRDLETICLKCLEKAPQRRYPTARALAEDVGRYLAGEPIQARPAGRAERLWRWCRRNPTVAALSAAIILVAVVGFAGVLNQWQAAEANQGKANEAAAEAKQKAKEAEDERDVAKRQRDKIRKVNEQLGLTQEELRSTLYAAQMNLVQNAWESDNLARVRDLLEQLRHRPGQTDLRGFEWHYWNRLSHAELRTIELGSQDLLAPTFSPDRTRFAALFNTPVPGKLFSFHSALRVWDTVTGKQRGALEGAADSINKFAFSPDGRRLAADDGSAVKIWDANSGKTLLAFPSPGQVTELQFRGDGRRLLAVVKAKGQKAVQIKVWEADTGKEIAAHPLPAGTDGKSVFSPDGRRLAVIVMDKAKLEDRYEVNVFDTDTGAEIATCPMAFGEMVMFFSRGTLTFSPDGKRIAAAVARYDADLLKAIKGPPDMERMLNSTTGGVDVWDADTGKQLLAFKGLPATKIGLAFSPDGSTLAAIDGAAGGVKVWDAITGKEKLTDPGRGSAAGADALQGVKPFFTLLEPGLVYSPDGKLLSATGFGTTVKVWDIGTDRLRLSLKGHTGAVAGAAFSANGKRLFSAAMDGTLKEWDPTRSDGPIESRGTLAVSADGKYLALVDSVVDLQKPQARQVVKVLDAGTRKELFAIRLKEGALGVGGLTFSPAGRHLAGVVSSFKAKTFDNEVKVWDAAKGNELFASRKPMRGLGGVGALTFSPDGKRLAAYISVDALKSTGQVEVWPIAEAGEPLTIPGGHLFWNLAFSADSKRLAVAEVGKLATAVVIRDAATGKEVRTLPVGPHNTGRLAFSPDGKHLAVAATAMNAAAASTEIKLWDTDTGLPRFVLKLSGQAFLVTFSPDGKRLASNLGANLATGQTGNEVKLWDAATGLELAAFKGPVSLPSSLAFSTDGTRLMLTGGNAQANRSLLQVWDATPLPNEHLGQK